MRAHRLGLPLVLAVVGASCTAVLGFQPAELIQPDGGSGAADGGTTSTGPTACTPGDTMGCYDGGPGTEGVGACVGGMATCNAAGTAYGACLGEVTPKPLSCAATADVACIGRDNCVRWGTTIGNPMGSGARAVAVDATGNSYVTGTFSGVIQIQGQSKPLTALGTADVFLIKLGPDGTPAWGQSFGAPGVQTQPFGVAVDPQGNVVIGGSAFASVAFGSYVAGPGAFVAKLNSTGVVQWAQGLTVNWKAPYHDLVQAVACTSAGDVMVGGAATSDVSFGDSTIPGPGSTPTGSTYGFLGKLRGSDGSGKVASGGWGRGMCSGTNGCAVAGLSVVAQDSVLTAGNFSGTLDFAPGDSLVGVGAYDVFVGAVTSTGASLWRKDIGGLGATTLTTGLAAAADGGPILSGNFTGTIQFDAGKAATGGGAFVVQYSGTGAYGWSQGWMNATGVSVAADAAGNAVVAGAFNGPIAFPGGSTLLTPMGSPNLFVAKLSSVPALLWAKGWGDGTSQPTPTDVAATPQGAAVVVGNIYGAIQFGSFPLSPAGQHNAFAVGLSP